LNLYIQLNPEDDIYQFIGKKLAGIIKNSIVLVNSYDKITDSFTLRALEGIGENIKFVLKTLRKNPFTISYPISDEKARSAVISGKFLKIPGGVHELSFGKIPKSISYVLEKSFNIGEINYIGFSREKEIFGNAVIIMRKGEELQDLEFINAFIKQASISLQHRQAVEELKNSEERLEILFDYAPDAYYLNDLTGKFLDGNKAAEKVTGYKKEELIGKSFLKLKLLSTADIPKAVKLLTKNLQGLPTGPDELTLIRKDRSKVIVEISTYPVKIKGKTLVLGIARDISARKRAEETLRRSQQEFKSIFDNNPVASLYLDNQGTVLDINSPFRELFGYSLKEIKGKDINSGIIHPPDKMKEIKKLFKKAIKGYMNYETIRKRKDGTLIPVSISSSSVLISGKTHGRIVLYQDISQRKQAEQKVEEGYKKLQKTMEATINTISKIIETRDPYTAGHQNKVSKLATAIAQEIQLSEEEIKGIRIASLVHDIGKMSIPAEILSKPSRLSDLEFNLIKNHPKIGYDILKKIDFSWPVAKIVLHHHEKIDGSGYPRGLIDKKILLEAKILCVADVVEAMSSHRPYRPALGINKALEEISQNRGILYDPEVVDACIKLFKEKGFKF